MVAPRLVSDLLLRSAGHTPDAPFLIDAAADSEWTYAQIADQARALAHRLREGGVRPGDRVALLAKNSSFYAASYYGALLAGAIVVPLNTGASGESLGECIRDCGAVRILVGNGMERLAEEAIANDVGMTSENDDLSLAPSSAPIDPSRGPDDPASIIYTSGSTARPRGATLSHRNLLANTASIVSYLQLSASDRALSILPFYYVYGKTLLNTHAAVGGSVVVENRFLFLNTALDTMQRTRCTGFAGVPSTFSMLLNRSNLAEREWNDLRYVTQAGGAMPPATTKRLMQALPNTSIFVMYGATEASARLSYLEPQELTRKLGSIGKAIPGVELRVLRDDGSEADVDETGEIVARGDNIMLGYWNDPEETAAVLDDEGFHTGDLGRRDAEGFFYVVGRKKEMIKSGAHRVSPKEIEEQIVQHGQVEEAAVIGVADDLLGEAIHAFVVLSGSAPDDVIERLADSLADTLPSYKLPVAYHPVASLPKNESGKVMKRELKPPSN